MVVGSLITISQAQLLKKSDYGAGLTIAFYQFDESRSKQFGEVTALKQTAATADEEIDYMTRTFWTGGDEAPPSAQHWAPRG
jgi:hypothetical protein